MKVRLWCLPALGLLATTSFGQGGDRPRYNPPPQPPAAMPRVPPSPLPFPPPTYGAKRNAPPERTDRASPVYRSVARPTTTNSPRHPSLMIGRPMREAKQPRRLFPQSTAPAQDEFAATFKEIKWMRPAVKILTLECDKEVIRTTLPEIQKVYAESGLTEDHAQAAALTAWKEVRLTSPLQPNKCMVSASYTAFTLSLGTLVFKTTPGDADITIDGKNIADKTSHSRLFESGIKRKVRFSKPGYAPVEVVCTAVERTSTDCYAELKPAPAPVP
ncbi:MAG: hypothetical protein QOG71_1490 [Pyrinomonadaceae bacterium]|nr:hypothetical protein [Pyrinomonadaceae bacterium]